MVLIMRYLHCHDIKIMYSVWVDTWNEIVPVHDQQMDTDSTRVKVGLWSFPS
jgi:hypothetical protein